MKRLFFISIVLFSFNGFSQGRVDGFYKGKGNFDAALSLGYEHNPNYYAGKTKVGLTRDIYFLNSFFAYGITDKFDVNFSLPFINVNGSTQSIQDANLTFKHLLFSHVNSRCAYKNRTTKTELSGSLGFSSNLTDYQTGGLNAIGQQAKIIDGRIVVHHQFSIPFFVTAQVGYSYKFEPTPSSLPFAIKFGTAQAKFYADVFYEYQHSFGGLDYKGTPAPSSFTELGVDFHKVGGAFYKPLSNKFGLVAGVSYIFLGRNSVEGFGVNAGIVYKHYKKTKE
ncbi:MAG: hypothetical protein ACWA41_07895 [Putridiphycobacter sp.]